MNYLYILRSSALFKNLDLMCARTFEDQVLDAFCVLLPTAEMSRKLYNWYSLNDKGMVRMCGYIKDTSNKYSLAFLSSSPPGCHGTAQHNCSKDLLLQSMQARLESCEETFQLCVLRLLISKIPTSVQSHAFPSAGQ